MTYTEEQKEEIIRMVGTKGLKDLEALARLLPKNHGIANPYSLAVHFIQMGIDESKEDFSVAIGITSFSKTGE